METNIISVKYEDIYHPKTFNGKAYHYYTNKKVEVGDLVIAPTTFGEKIARVSEINIPIHKIEMMKQYLKTITQTIEKEAYLMTDEKHKKQLKPMSETDVADILIEKLLNKNFIVHRYNSYSTSSIYLKLDYGLACGIRIANHSGKKKYHYRFNVIKDYVGNEIINRDNLISYFFNYNELDKVLNAVHKEKQSKLRKYGIQNYKKYMERQSQTDLYTRFIEMKGETKR